jgi:hypothetical protein
MRAVSACGWQQRPERLARLVELVAVDTAGLVSQRADDPPRIIAAGYRLHPGRGVDGKAINCNLAGLAHNVGIIGCPHSLAIFRDRRFALLVW